MKIFATGENPPNLFTIHSYFPRSWLSTRKEKPIMTLLLQIFEITLTMSAVIALLLTASRLYGKRFTAKCRYIVWLVVIVRLCIPLGVMGIAPVFEFSLPERAPSADSAPPQSGSVGATPSAPSTPGGVGNADNNSPSAPVVPDVPATQGTPVTPSTSINEVSPDTPGVPVTPSVPVTPGQNIPTVPDVPSTGGTEKPQWSLPDFYDVLNIVGIVYLAGAVIFMSVRLIGYAHFMGRIKKLGALREAGEGAERAYLELAHTMGIKKPPVLRVTGIKISPFLSGYAHPMIVIPESVEAGDTLERILAHELTHYRRGDVYIKLLCTVAESLHWFNPLVHIAAARMNSEIEFSCDEAVLRGSDEMSRMSYGSTMLELARDCSGVVHGAGLTSHFNPGHGALKERIMRIIDMEKKRRGLAIIAIVMALCIISGAVIGCAVPSGDSDKTHSEETTHETEKDPSETDLTGVHDGMGILIEDGGYPFITEVYVPKSIKLSHGGVEYEVRISHTEDAIYAERFADGETDILISATFDEDGKLAVVTTTDANENVLRTKNFRGGYEFGGLNYRNTDYERADGFSFSKQTIAIDDTGDVERVSRPGHESEHEIYKDSYNDKGRLTKRYIDATGNGDYESEIIYQYNDDGKPLRITENLYRYGKMTKRDTYYTYGEHGLLEEKKVNYSADFYPEDYPDNKEEFFDLYTYSYDSAAGTWTEHFTAHHTDETVVSREYSVDGNGRYTYLKSGDSEYSFTEVELSGGKEFMSEVDGGTILWEPTTPEIEERYMQLFADTDSFDMNFAEANKNYLLTLHRWCFDDLLNESVAEHAAVLPYADFEGADVASEADAREKWYNNYNVDDGIVSICEAILNVDIEKLAELDSYNNPDSSIFESYKGMKIGRYKLRKSEKYAYLSMDYLLEVEILESNNSTLTPGWHTLLPSNGLGLDFYREEEFLDTTWNLEYDLEGNVVGMTNPDRPETPEERTKWYAETVFNSDIDSESILYATDDDSRMRTTWVILSRLMYFLNHPEAGGMTAEEAQAKYNEGWTVDEVIAYAEKYLGIKDFVPNDHGVEQVVAVTKNEKGNYVQLGRGYGGPCATYETRTEADGTIVTVMHLWADRFKTVRAYDMEYRFKVINGEPVPLTIRKTADYGYKHGYEIGT